MADGKHSEEALGKAARPAPSIKSDAPAKPGTKPATKTRRRGPQHAEPTAKKAPAKTAAAVSDEVAESRRSRRTRDLIAEGRAAAMRGAMRAGAGGKPSVTGRAVGGAAAGAAVGSAIAPGPGTAVGAAVGGVGGALAGRAAKKAYKLARHASPGARKLIVAEFLVCMAIAALSPLSDRKKDETAGRMMKRLTAIMGVFFILGLVSAAGRGPSKFAAGFGGLITAALALSERDVFLKIATTIGSPEPAAVSDEVAMDVITGARAGGEVGQP